MNMRNIIADALIMGLSASLLWHFSNIWRYGQYLAVEPDITLRILETALLASVFIFGAVKLIKDAKTNSRASKVSS